MQKRKEYNTRGLSRVLECLKEADGKHMTAEEIASHIESKGAHIGTATVYRNLDKLLARGEIARYQGDGSACYCIEKEHCHAQIHLVCSGCGRLLHLECGRVDDLSDHIAKEHGFALDRRRTVLYGLCNECRV